MINRACAVCLASIAAAVAETIDRSFDWGSAAAGAGLGVAAILLLLALGAAVKGSRSRGGRDEDA